MSAPSLVTEPANIAAFLVAMAGEKPHTKAVVAPSGRDRAGRVRYTHFTYRQLNRDSDHIALGLIAAGIERGTRAVLLVRPGLDFFSLVFALFKAGIVPVVIDPGIGLRSLAQCVREAAPEAFIGIPKAIAAHWALGWGRKTVRRLVWVGPGRPPGFDDGDHDACRPAQGGQGRAGRAA